jgi:hypothetical protein
MLGDLIALNADVKLCFDDGSTLDVNSAFISVHSSVLRGAVEATGSIPIAGVSKEEWLEAAAFWYPVVPSPEISCRDQAELLLKVGSKFDIQLVLHKVDLYLKPRARLMQSGADTDPASIWRWIRLAETAGLTVCLSKLADRAVAVDRAGCEDRQKLDGLSKGMLMEIVMALSRAGRGAANQHAYCRNCYVECEFCHCDF